MLSDERLETYLRALSTGQGIYLDRIRAEAEKSGVPVIRTEMESFLAVLLNLKRPDAMLEAGTAVGYSAMVLARAAADWNGRIDTVEKDEGRCGAAERNIQNSPWANQIRLIRGDVAEVFRKYAEEKRKYGFLFMDAAKGQYLRLLPDALRLLETGGVLVSDNVLQEGTILDSRFALERRERTIHARMREYLYVLKHTDGLLTTVVPVGDGAAVTVKTRDVDFSEMGCANAYRGKTAGASGSGIES